MRMILWRQSVPLFPPLSVMEVAFLAPPSKTEEKDLFFVRRRPVGEIQISKDIYLYF